MRLFVIITVAGLVAAYSPPNSGRSDCVGGEGGCGSSTGSNQVVTSYVPPCPGGSCGSPSVSSGQVITHAFPCPGGNCGISSSSSSASSSDDYWWQGQNNPFDSLESRPPIGSHSCSGSSCGSGSPLCPGSGCPSITQPVPGISTRPLPQPSPGTVSPSSHGSIQNLLAPPMGICPAKYVCVNWQLCRNGYVIDDGTGTIDKQRKVIPPRITSTYTSCGGDMICCGITEHSSGSETVFQPAKPARLPNRVHPLTPESPPQLPGPGTGTQTAPEQPIYPYTPSSSLTLPSSGLHPTKLSGPDNTASPSRPISPTKFSGPGTAVSPSRPVIPTEVSGSGTIPSPSSPVNSPKFTKPATPSRPVRPVSPGSLPQKHSFGSITPSRPNPQPSVPSQSYGYPSPGTQQPAGPNPLPSVISQASPIFPSQPLRPVSSPVGLTSPAGGNQGASGGMMGMGMMGMMLRSGSCSAAMYCVPQQQCNPYNGFIIRANTPVMAVWPESPTVPLLPCFVPDGSITDGVCCQEAHPNAAGFD